MKSIDSLLLHPSMKKTLLRLAQDPPQAVLLSGATYSGKEALLHALSYEITQSNTMGFKMTIAPIEDKKTIGIEQIQTLKKALKNKDSNKRVIVIPNVDSMTIEAQNSFLKLLEEPGDNIHFLLSSSYPNNILATIRSRVIHLRYIAPGLEQQKEFIYSMHSSNSELLLKIAKNKIGLIVELCGNTQSSHIIDAIENAKEILSESTTERLVKVDTLAKDKEKTLAILRALLLVCEGALDAIALSNKPSYKAWLKRVALIEQSITSLQNGIMVKLVLSRLFLML